MSSSYHILIRSPARNDETCGVITVAQAAGPALRLFRSTEIRVGMLTQFRIWCFPNGKFQQWGGISQFFVAGELPIDKIIMVVHQMKAVRFDIIVNGRHVLQHVMNLISPFVCLYRTQARWNAVSSQESKKKTRTERSIHCSTNPVMLFRLKYRDVCAAV